MNYNELNDKLQELATEDYIWVIYIVIIILSWYSNNLERDYFINNNIESQEKYRQIIILIFSILLIIYFYFFKSSIDGINNLKWNDSRKKIDLSYLSLLASFLIVISGVIFLYIALVDESIEIEMAFN